MWLEAHVFHIWKVDFYRNILEYIILIKRKISYILSQHRYANQNSFLIHPKFNEYKGNLYSSNIKFNPTLQFHDNTTLSWHVLWTPLYWIVILCSDIFGWHIQVFFVRGNFHTLPFKNWHKFKGSFYFSVTNWWEFCHKVFYLLRD